MPRILTLTDLSHAAAEWRREGTVIVLAAGCFDPLHVGHVQHFRAARELGNVLVVAVTADAYVGKGPGRPRSPDTHRAEVVAAMREVDAVAISHGPNTVQIIQAIRPHVFVKGVEYLTNRTPQILAETAAVECYGGRVEYVTGQVVCSSTAILAGTTDGKVTCDHCHGTTRGDEGGFEAQGALGTCGKCRGTGKVNPDQILRFAGSPIDERIKKELAGST